MEYREDLEYYWIDGPGFPITAAQSCIVMDNLIHSFMTASNVEEEQRIHGVFYFSHSGAVLKYMAFLGLYEDVEPLRSDNFDSMKDSRQWRTSNIGPFAANVVFVLFDCRTEEASDYHEDFTEVQLYVNERLMKIPGCGEEVCTLTRMKEAYSKPCNFQELCSLEEEGVSDTEVSDDQY